MPSSVATIMSLVNRIKWLCLLTYTTLIFLHYLFLLSLNLFHPSLLHCRLLLLANLFPAMLILGHLNCLLLLLIHIFLVSLQFARYFFPNLTRNLSKLSSPDLACNIPTKHNHLFIFKSVQAFGTAVVNINFVSVSVCPSFLCS